MRNLILLILFSVLFLRNNSNAQTYISFPDSNAVWTRLIETFSFPLSVDYLQDYFIVSGDTTLNNITYHKFFWEITPNLSNSASPIGYYREVSSEKIYFRMYSDTTEYLWYDFNVSVGDTIFHNSNWMAPYEVVTAVDSFLISGVYRKSYSANQDKKVAGIGSLSHPINQAPYGTGGYASVLLCFSQNGQTIYVDSNFNSCNVVGVEELNKQNFEIYPNPVENYLTISSSNKINSIKIYSADLKELINKKINLSTSTVVDVSSLRPGLYFLSVENEKGIQVFRKIIKM